MHHQGWSAGGHRSGDQASPGSRLPDFHESNKEFREAALAKAEPHHGQHPLEHMLRLEVVDMQRVRSDRFGMYHAYSRRARDWAVQLCEVDFSEKVRKKEVSASDHTMTGK